MQELVSRTVGIAPKIESLEKTNTASGLMEESGWGMDGPLRLPFTTAAGQEG